MRSRAASPRRRGTRRRRAYQDPLHGEASTPSTAHSGPIQRPARQSTARPRVRGIRTSARRPAVPDERDEVVMAHVAYQPAHAQERRDEAATKRRRTPAGRGRRGARCLQDLVAVARTAWEWQEEREFGGRGPRQAEQHAADDRRPERECGNERERLARPTFSASGQRMSSTLPMRTASGRSFCGARPTGSRRRRRRTRRRPAPARTGRP